MDSQPTADSIGQEQNKQTPIKDHQWLEYMDRFSTGIFSLPPDEYINSVPNLPAELRRDVRICLIDDGVDMQHKSIMERIEDGGRAFGAYTRDEYRGMARPFYDSTTNHGTLMANMMIRVCPFAKIASYRLDTRRGEDSSVHFTAKSAADVSLAQQARVRHSELTGFLLGPRTCSPARLRYYLHVVDSQEGDGP